MAYEPSYPQGPSTLGVSAAAIGAAHRLSGGEAPRRQYRLDDLASANEQSLKKASETLSKLRAVRERLSGPWPEPGDKAEVSRPSRPGHIGRIEDQCFDLHRMLLAIDDLADHLLGV